MASTEEFMLRLAQEEGIPTDRIRPVINRLLQEWYDTVESLRKLSAEEMERLSIPHRLARLITEKLAEGGDKHTEETASFSATPAGKVEEIPNKGDALAALVSAGVEDQVEGGLADCITTLQLIFVNILRHPGEEKYTRLRLTNPSVRKRIERFPPAVLFLRASGFSSDGAEMLVLRQVDNESLRDSLQELNVVAENLGFPAMEAEEKPLNFDPYKAQVSSINPDNPKISATDNDPAVIARKKAQLEREREEAAKRTQVDRNPVVFRISEGGSLQAALREMEAAESRRLASRFGVGYTVEGGRIPQSPAEDEEMAAMKLLLRENEENSKFHSKRKMELSRLERQKSYTAVTIRIRFPDRYILQGTFSAVDTTQHVYEFLTAYLATSQRPFCLFVSPPKQVIEASPRKTLKEFAPATLVNFAWRDLRETTPQDGPFLREEMKTAARNYGGS